MWDERYAAPGFAYGTEPNDFLVAQAGALRGPVLCLAEGEGRNAVWLAQRGLQVTAVDASRVGLEKAQAFAQARGVWLETVHADLTTYELGVGVWGSIVSIWAHLPPTARQQLHRRCVAALAPGGVLVLEAYTPRQILLGTGGPKDPALCMTADGLRAELAGLEPLLLDERERDVHEGTFHQGRSAVVQLFARKPG